MMVTGYEVQMYADIKRIANALERVAKALEAQAPQAGPQDPRPELKRGAVGGTT